MNGGIGELSAKIQSFRREGHSQPDHPVGPLAARHDTSDDINYVLSGRGKALCDGTEESLYAGCCHICLQGSEHSIINTGDGDLCLLTVVTERTAP